MNTGRRTRNAAIVLLFVACVTTAFVAGCGRGSTPAGAVPGERVGPWRVSVANAPDPPRVGENRLDVTVRDSSGRPLRGTVDVLVSMPAMGAMPYMESRGTVKPAGAGVFHAAYGLAMNGDWDLRVQIHPDGGAPAEAQYRLSTSLAGVAPAGGADEGPSPRVGSPDSSIGAVSIGAARRQSLGIRTEPVEMRELASTLRAPGRVAFDEAHRADVTARFGGVVRDLNASVTGRAVRRGEVLFTAYSPDLWAAQQEYLEALRAAAADRDKPVLGASSGELARAARERLELWDLSAADLDALARAGRPLAAFPVRSPASGVVTEKNVVAGSAFMPGQVLFRIARLDPAWVIASVPQSDLDLLRPGMTAQVLDPDSGPGARAGRVAFVYPALDSATRTGEVRITLANPGGRLQPGRYVSIEIVTPSVRRLAVPESAVLPTGERDVVFVDLGEGRLAPREVRLGRRAGGYVEVLAGLRAGEEVVTSGNFLVAAESRLRSAGQTW